MANAAIAYNNLADNGAFTTISSQATNMPVTFLQNVHVQKRWRSLTAADYFIIDLGLPQSLDTIGVFGITVSAGGSPDAGGTIRVRASATDSTFSGSPDLTLYDSGVVTVNTTYNSHVSVIPSPVTARYVRVDLTTTDTYLEAGRLFVGLRTAFTKNFAYGWQRGWVDRSIRSKTRGGQTQVFVDNHYRTLQMTFEFLSASEATGIVETIDAANGQNKDVLMILDTASTNLARDSIWGLMSELSTVSQPHFDLFSKTYNIEERL